MIVFNRKTHLSKYWFLYGIFFSIILAFIYPEFGSKEGLLKPEWTIKSLGTIIIFLLNGCSIRKEELYRTVLQYRIHLCIQLFSFLICPILFTILSTIYRSLTYQYQISIGIKALGTLPSPVSTAAVVVRAIGGNEAIAMLNSTIGSLLGTMLTPILLYMMLGGTFVGTQHSFIHVLISLSSTILLPISIGQLFRIYFPIAVNRIMPYSNIINNWILLGNIYVTFCQTFKQHGSLDLTFINFIILFTTILVIQILLIAVLFFACQKSHVRPNDTIAIIFCGSQKSLTSGMPILQMIFPDNISITIPLLIYHPMQIILGNYLTGRFQRWLKDAKHEWHHRISGRIVIKKKMSTPSRLRLMRDFKQLQKDPPAGIAAVPSDDNILIWHAFILGPSDTPFEDGTFRLLLEFTESYPNKPPSVRFTSKMFHPNVYADGGICLDILQNRWSPTYDVSAILTSIQSLLDEPNVSSPANSEAANLYQTNRREYEKRVKTTVEQSWNAEPTLASNLRI
ncbi:unnamed protein product [Rotaria magnacalcarata]|uniref:E2 ubiquitin-conjugating enzyme n=1 Tax=Rotaria magnacalcarata TaxID=392030 RepID=A0A819AAM5_9BILA|nr:unnamed protein product [Rotaria magnacalcarata]CAF2072851.1 unnamed protein product [Rotaria magnacalcarata]CAF2094483.1 unnamed protein product [Rotaria magnacalcarata]CAF2164963.1 unnamed protein product [Rotaria magnacalcarata]CAF3780605.1 unnamed protein product [Rotaria magnacalcarata]